MDGEEYKRESEGVGERQSGASHQGSQAGRGAQKEVITFECFSNASSQGFGTQHVGNRVPASFSVA